MLVRVTHSLVYHLCYMYECNILYIGLSAPDEAHSSNVQCELTNNPCSQESRVHNNYL